MKKRVLLVILSFMMVIRPLTVSASSQEEVVTTETEESLPTESEITEGETESESSVAEETEDTMTSEEEIETGSGDAATDAQEPIAAEVRSYTNDVEGFVERLYNVCLGRSSDPKGKADWVSQLKTGKKTAAEIVWGFYDSDEYKNKKTTDSDFVESLYKVMLDRNSDATGKANWLKTLSNGVSRRYIVKGFVGSKEFSDICSQYNVARGSLVVTEGRDLNYKVTCFVQSLYQGCLGRGADTTGLNTYCNAIVKSGKSAAAIVRELFNSKEYKNKNKSDADYIEDIYKTMLNRSSDSAGKATWATTLGNGVSRDYIIKGFAGNPEFKNLCASYGITAGSITLTEDRDQNYNATKFVQRLYQTCFGRKADTSGLNNWTGGLNKRTSTGASVVKGIFESAEYTGKKKSNENYVIDLYKALLDRSPDASGKASWLNALSGGSSRRDLLRGFTGSTEFKNLCAKYGIMPGTILTEAEERIQKNTSIIYASVGKDLKACYWWVVNNLSYTRINGHLTPPSGYSRDQWYAVKAFEEKTGNCYFYAAAFCWLARGLGYEAQYIEGKVTSTRGGYVLHGWVNIKIDGTWYICDPEAQYAYTKYYNFYMQPLGNTVLSYIW